MSTEEQQQQTFNLPTQFRLDPQQGLDVETLTPYLREILTLCFRFVDFREGAIEQLVFVDEDRFGETVYEFQQQAGRTQEYTNRGYFRAITKNVPRAREDGGVTSTIVVDSRIFYRLAEMIEQGVPLEEWDTDHQFWLHILVTEFARCLDHAERKDIADAEFDFEETYDHLLISAHYVPTVVGSFVTGVLASRSVTPALREKLITDWHQSVGDVLDPLLDRKMGFDGNLMRDAAHAFWSFLSLYGQLIGHGVGKPSLGDVPPWPHAGEEAESALEEFAAALRSLWDLYPNLPPHEELTALLLTPWHRLTEAHGFIFNDEPEEEDEE